MIEYAEHLFHPHRREGMIQRRGKVKQDQADPIHGEAGNPQRVSVQHRQHDQHDESGDAQKCADTVCDAVGDFFTHRVFRQRLP